MSDGTTQLVSARWGCDRCAAGGDRKNALAVAARHAKAHRHPTWAEQTQRTSYGAPAAAGNTGQGSFL